MNKTQQLRQKNRETDFQSGGIKVKTGLSSTFSFNAVMNFLLSESMSKQCWHIRSQWFCFLAFRIFIKQGYDISSAETKLVHESFNNLSVLHSIFLLLNHRGDHISFTCD